MALPMTAFDHAASISASGSWCRRAAQREYTGQMRQAFGAQPTWVCDLEQIG
jgi:hypothetical protein